MEGKPCKRKEHLQCIEMNEQTRDFALDKTGPVCGSLQIEGGNISVDVRNLQPAGHEYKLFLIGRKDSRSVYRIAGDIIPDRHGNVSFRTAIDAENVDGKGSELSCFYIFMVAAMGQPIRPVLKGDKPDRQNCSIGPHGRRNDSRERYNDYYSEYIRYKSAALIGAADQYEEVSPFDDVWLTDRWKRSEDPARLPVASIGAERQFVKYGHFIYGFTAEHFYLGIPGRHTSEEWPDKGESGFLLWQSIRGSDEYGYWCLVIELSTGEIVKI